MTRRSFKSRLAGGFCLRAPAQGTCTQYRPGFPCCSGSIEAARALPGLLRLGRAGPGAARLPGTRPHPVPEQNLSLAVSGRLFP